MEEEPEVLAKASVTYREGLEQHAARAGHGGRGGHPRDEIGRAHV